MSLWNYRRARRRMAFAIPTVVAVVATAFPSAAAEAQEPAGQAACPWLNEKLPISQRVSELVSAMTLDQKITEMQARHPDTTGPYAGYEAYVPPQPSLCIPALVEQDGPAGVHAPHPRFQGADTQLPAPVALASAWDPSLAYRYGSVNGAEHWGQGITMVHAPSINIQRDPRWGRNFEMLSEDPYLSAALGVSDTEGLQSQHVIADVKHYVAYNQETHRTTLADNDIISERALREIYMPAFEANMKQAHPGAVMCSHNLINGTFACEDPYVLTTVLRDEWGFQGFIRSDGRATHSTAASVNAGEDQEGPNTNFYGNGQLAAAVADGQVSMATIDKAVGDIFTSMFRQGLFDHPPTGRLQDDVTTAAHAAFARTVAELGTVLLKNRANLLPIGSGVNSIAVIGADGTTSPQSAGNGSAQVNPPYVVSPLEGITDRAGPGVEVSSYSGTDPSQAAATAGNAQLAIVFASNVEGETADLPNITLPKDQDAYIQAVADANPNTIVVLNTGGPVEMPWAGDVASILEGWYPGQEDGNALAAVLFGDVNPGGHLPETFPVHLSDTPTSDPCSFPGCNSQVHYAEGVKVGYRWYDANGSTPLFPFGYGLSYTQFAFSNLSLTPANSTGIDANGEPNRVVAVAHARLTNTGSRTGSEVTQLYLGDPASTGEPVRQLRGFQRVTLAPGQSQQVTFPLTARDLAYWDSATHSWAVSSGTYQVYVGDSSALRDLPLHASFGL